MEVCRFWLFVVVVGRGRGMAYKSIGYRSAVVIMEKLALEETMAIKAIEACEAFRSGFLSGNSDPLAEILNEDFIFIGPTGTRSKEETLNWVSSTPDLQQGDAEVLYENDDVLVGLFDLVRSQGRGTARVMFFARLRNGKLSYWRVHLAPTE